MEEEDSVKKALPWWWVIEALARSQQLSIELLAKLHDLFGDVDDEVREAVALRCLEVLCDFQDGLSDCHASSWLLRIEFDVAESCDDVLRRIWHKTSGFSLLKDVSDEIKSELRSFVEHKKASLPRSTLELLKSIILEGTHPLAASLKEFSGLALEKQCLISIPYGGSDLNCSLLMADENGHGNHTMLVERSSDSEARVTEKPVQVDSSTVYENGHGKEAMPVEGDNDSKDGIPEKPVQADSSVVHENGHGKEATLVEGDNDSKEGIPETPVQANSSVVYENGHGNEATLVEGGNDSEDEIPEKSVQVDLSLEVSLHSKRDTSHLCVDSCVLGTDDSSQYIENHVSPAKKLKLDKQFVEQPMQDGSVPSGKSKRPICEEAEQSHELPKANGMHGRRYQESFGDPVKTCAENSDQGQSLPDNDEPLPGKIDFQKKLSFLSSQWALGDEILTMSDTEADLCMKCNKGGQLLICSACACPLAFHESCLGCSAIFDDQGKFCCPFCAYSRAISEYFIAKKKASFARKELSLFIGGRDACQPELDPKRGLEDVAILQGENKTAQPKNGADVGTQVANNLQFGNSKVREQETQVDKNLQFDCSKDKEQETQVANDLQFGSSKVKEQELPAPSFPIAGNASASAASDICSEDRRGAETMIHLARDETQMQNQEQGHKVSHSCKLSHGNEKITNANQESTKVGVTKETPGYQDNELQAEASSESISNSDGHSHNEKRKATKNIDSAIPLRAVPMNQTLRRKKLPWTAEEEVMLKKGVQEFAREDNRAIPWKDILEYGSSVFQKGRTAVDLKDKWKRMSKAK